MAAHPHSAPASLQPHSQAYCATPSVTLHPSPFNYDFMPPSAQAGFAPVGGYFPPQREVDPFYATPLHLHSTPTRGRDLYPQVMTTEKSQKGVKKAEGKTPTFLIKLYSILDTPKYSHMIRWDNLGDSIVISRPELLATTVLPLVYRQNRFASFSRQLNIYGFMRKTTNKQSERSSYEAELSVWTHPTLRRGSTHEEVLRFKRRVPPRPSQRKGQRLATTPDIFMSPLSTSDSIASPDPFSKLLGDEEDLNNAMGSKSLGTDSIGAVGRFSVVPNMSSHPFQLHSAPTGSLGSYPITPISANRARYDWVYVASHMLSPSTDSAMYSPESQASDMSPTRGSHVFNAPTFALNDASTWSSCGLAYTSPVNAYQGPPGAPSQLAVESCQDIFTMSPNSFQKHPTPASSNLDVSAPRSIPPSCGSISLSPSQRRSEKASIASQPYPVIRPHQGGSLPMYHGRTCDSTNGKNAARLERWAKYPREHTGPIALPPSSPSWLSPLREDSGATFMGARGPSPDEMDSECSALKESRYPVIRMPLRLFSAAS